ncbi:MAG: hypothetical protein KDC95_11105, partial [Planctomycetes bacterium]|nr:hypothetical protein [Planctomycetota bacterium]
MRVGPPAPHPALRLSFEQLTQDLDHVPNLILRSGKAFLARASGGELRVVGAHDYDPLVELPDHRVLKIGEGAYWSDRCPKILDEAIAIAPKIPLR